MPPKNRKKQAAKKQECPSDAQLAAAARDLYEALRGAIDQHHEYFRKRGKLARCTPELEPAYNNCLAALEKAEQKLVRVK